MRVMLNVSFPVEVGNASIKDGKLPKTIMGAIDQMKPECSYFYPLNGKRHATFVFDLKESSQIVPVAERFFFELNAEVELTPVMNLEDLQKGLSTFNPK